MRRILIATPEKALISRFYGMSALEFTALIAKGRPDIELVFQFCSGTSVNFARNELADFAIRNDFDDLVFIDSDMGKWVPQLMRLLDHDVPVVCGLYTPKRLVTAPWLTVYPGAAVQEDGLIRAAKIPTGFMRIKVKEVFPKLQKAFPESAYFGKNKEPGGPPVILHEFFPMGVIGPNAFEYKVQEIKKVLASRQYWTSEEGTDFERMKDDIQKIVDCNLPGNLQGEDYYFCHRCVEAAVELYADTHLMIPHFDYSTQYPPDPQELIAYAEKLKVASK